MAKLYVTELWGQGSDNAGRTSASPRMPALAEQVIPFAASAVSSDPFNKNTKLVRVHTDGVCSVVVGEVGVEATTNNMRMLAGQTEYFSVQGGHVISVIQNT